MLQMRRGLESAEVGPEPMSSLSRSERSVSPSMRMEQRQKRHIIEEVAVYDSQTFYEDISQKRARRRDDRSDRWPGNSKQTQQSLLLLLLLLPTCNSC